MIMFNIISYVWKVANLKEFLGVRWDKSKHFDLEVLKKDIENVFLDPYCTLLFFIWEE